MLPLRDYQQRIVDDLLHTHDNVLVTLPTGGGKTLTICEYIIQQALHTVVVAHRRELLEQFETLLQHTEELDYELYTVNKLVNFAGPDDNRVLKFLRPQVGMVVNGYEGEKEITTQHGVIQGRSKWGLLVIDEAHRAAGDSYVKIIERAQAKGYRIIGLSATPIRGDGKPLGFLFDRILQGPTHKELIDRGYIVPCGKIFSTPRPLNLSNIPVTAGEYQLGKAGAFCSESRHKAQVVDTWQKHASSRKTVAFCCTVNHCYTLAAQFRASGTKVEVITGRTPHKQRKTAIEMLRCGDTKVLITCLVFTEGIDIKEIDCIIIDRPTRLLNLWIQIVGRAARAAEGKKDFWIIDHCGLYHNFGQPLSDNVQWSLHSKPLILEYKPPVCKSCGVGLDISYVEKSRRNGKAMVCSMCLTPYTQPIKLSWEDRVAGDLVLFSQDEPINPCGYEWRKDVTTRNYAIFKELLSPVSANQHRIPRRLNILEKARDFQRKQLTTPLTVWFLPTCEGLSSEEIHAACLHVTACIGEKRPEEDRDNLVRRARAMYYTETGKKLTEPDCQAVEQEFIRSLLPTDLSEI